MPLFYSFRVIGILVGALSICGGTARAESIPPSQAKPNILFLLTDDQAFDTIAALGNEEVETPNFDRLVARGTTFTRAYNMGSWSGAVCIASRAMLVTGRSVWEAKAVHDAIDRERAAERWWPEYMRQAGYRTYMTGKWHIPDPPRNSFDVVGTVRGGMPKDTPEGYDRPRDDRPDPWSPSDPRFGGFWQGGKHWSEVTADEAIGFLDRSAPDDSPFFMYVAFNAPHDPRQSPSEVVAKYPPERLSLPENFLPEYPHKEAIGCGPGLRDERLAPFPRTAQAVKVHRAEYYAAVTHLDRQIGSVLDALDESGAAERTWIFFTSDHGLAVGRHGLLGKQNLYEHSVRVPLVVIGPGVTAGKRIDAPVYLQDVMPTTLELAGIPKPEHVDFHSLLPLLRGETDRSAYDAIYGSYLDLQRSITADGYKLILYPNANVTRLYHLAEDPLEMQDLAADPANVNLKRQLFQRLLALQKELGDPLDLTATFPNLAVPPAEGT